MPSDRETRIYRVAFGLSFVLVRAANEREALSAVRDKIDREQYRRNRKPLQRGDYTVRVATDEEVTMMARAHRFRKDQGVLDL
jgi:hypothetical protein